MTTTNFKLLLAKLAKVQEPLYPEIRNSSKGTKVDEITLNFAIDCSNDKWSENILEEINSILHVYNLKATWTGNGDGDYMDATVTVPIEGAYFRPYGFGTNKLVLT